MRNIIKFSKENNFEYEASKTFTGFNKVKIKVDNKIITVSERSSSKTYTIRGYQGHSEKYSVSISGERYTFYFNTQKECVKYIQECL